MNELMPSCTKRSLPTLTTHASARLLIVDDEPMNVTLLRDLLGEAGYSSFYSTNDPRKVLEICKDFLPDLILLDWMMPFMTGTDVLELLKREWEPYQHVPVLILTADISPSIKRLALVGGASDFLTKPFDTVELLLRLRNLLEIKFLHENLIEQNSSLENRVRERTEELECAAKKVISYAQQLEEAQFETLERLAWAGEFRDDVTGNHTIRVGATTAALAAQLGFSTKKLDWLSQAARLHDIGKIGIPDEILLKPARLTPTEFDFMKTHTTIGATLLRGGKSDLLQIAENIALNHHERWDGTGYPNNLCEEKIPMEARLVAVADVFDALTHERPYKSAWSVSNSVAEIASQSGKQFDPQVIDAFLQLAHDKLI